MTDKSDPADLPAFDSDRPEWAQAHGPLRSFGRIKSRPIKARQAALFDTLMPQIAVPDPTKGPIDPAALMPEAKQVWLEIGFGGGEHLAEQAGRNPEALMIGCEPFLNGVASALRHVEEGGLKNVRLHAFIGGGVARAGIAAGDILPQRPQRQRRAPVRTADQQHVVEGASHILQPLQQAIEHMAIEKIIVGESLLRPVARHRPAAGVEDQGRALLFVHFRACAAR